MRGYTFPAALTAVVSAAVLGLTVASTTARTQESVSPVDKHVKIRTDAVEFVSYAKTAEKCKSGKGETVRLRVKSADPVDVRLYIAQPRGKWLTQDFPGQKLGDEVTSYQCDRTPEYRVYARPAGTTGEWAKP